MTTPPARWLRGAVVGAALLLAAVLVTPVGPRSQEPSGVVPAETEVFALACGAVASQPRFWEDFPEVEPPPLHLRIWGAARRNVDTGILLGLVAGAALPGLLLGIGVLEREEEFREWRRVRGG